MKSILILIDHFGPWPPWLPLFLESCRTNSSIDWLIHSDCAVDTPLPPNVRLQRIGWSDYVRRVSQRLDIEFRPAGAYKVCDIRPALGVVWAEDIANHDFFGYGDIDLVYGDIRHFYTDDVLNRAKVLSTHEWCFSGHLCLIRNEPQWVHAFRRVPGWRRSMETPGSVRFDEDHFFRPFVERHRFQRWPGRMLGWLRARLDPGFRRRRDGVYMREQFTTPLVPGLWQGQDVQHSDRWFWRSGRLTNADNPGREFIYLHFMNFVSGRWMDPRYGHTPPWEGLMPLVKVTPQDMVRGFQIGLHGFEPLTSET